MIPKRLHIVWIGDENRRPDECIATWRENNPGWDLTVWGNAELFGRRWVNHRHMGAMAERELNGVADMMRYEILYEHGGFAVDADSVCVRALEDWLLAPAAFTCWENETRRPGLLAAGYLAAEARHPLVRCVIEDLRAEKSVVDRMAWQSTGPQRLTDTRKKHPEIELTVYPSHYFIPQHYDGTTYEGDGPVFARQLWATTRALYGKGMTSDV